MGTVSIQYDLAIRNGVRVRVQQCKCAIMFSIFIVHLLNHWVYIFSSCLFAAPEVLKSKGYNRSLDMWSVGVIIYVRSVVFSAVLLYQGVWIPHKESLL